MGDIFPAYNLWNQAGVKGQVTVNFGATQFLFTPSSDFAGFDAPPPVVVVPPHVMLWIPEHPPLVTNHLETEAGEPLATELNEVIGWDDDGSFWTIVRP
jgi:hypothetical protein